MHAHWSQQESTTGVPGRALDMHGVSIHPYAAPPVGSRGVSCRIIHCGVKPAFRLG